MPNNGSINLFDTHSMIAVVEQVAPVPSFFRDRYFVTGEEDYFNTEKVLIEFADGDYQMAPIVARSLGDIPVEREKFEIHELAPAYIGVSRPLTADMLSQRGFGEALFANAEPAKRAARLMLGDFRKLDARIARREEWLCVQTMLNNACEMQEYLDANTKGDKNFLCFYEDKDEHKYIMSAPWTKDTDFGTIASDIIAMCDKLVERGLPAEDLVIGDDIAAIFRSNKDIREVISKTSGINAGGIDESRISGATRMGRINFGGYDLEVFNARGVYRDVDNVIHKYFPRNGILVSAPESGSLKYGAITQKEHGQNPESWFTRSGKRIPKLIVDVNKDTQALRLACRPLPHPKNRTPWIYCENN